MLPALSSPGGPACPSRRSRSPSPTSSAPGWSGLAPESPRRRPWPDQPALRARPDRRRCARPGHRPPLDQVRRRRPERSAARPGRSAARRRERHRADRAGTTGQHQRQEVGRIETEAISAAFLGGPGVLDRPSCRFRYAPRMPGWSKPGTLDQLAEAVGCSLAGCSLDWDNDVACATIAEAAHGAAIGVANFVYLWVGSGVGLGIWIDGDLYRGGGSAGEVGFMPLAATTGTDNSRLSPIERREGLVERAVSADGVLRTARALGLRQAQSAKDVFALAREGNQVALDVIDLQGKRIAHAVAAIVAILDPGLLVLGGAVGRNTDLLTRPLSDELARLTPLRPQIVGAPARRRRRPARCRSGSARHCPSAGIRRQDEHGHRPAR